MAALTFIQANSSVGAASNISPGTLAFNSNVTNGSFLLCWFGFRPGAAVTLTNIQDSRGNTWTQIGSKLFVSAVEGANSMDVYAFMVPSNVSSGANTVTITPSGATVLYAAVAEFTAQALLNVLDTFTPSIQHVLAGTVTAGTVITASSNEEVIVIGVSPSGFTSTAGTGYNSFGLNSATTGAFGEYAAQSTPGSYAPTFAVVGANIDIGMFTLAVRSTSTPAPSSGGGGFGSLGLGLGLGPQGKWDGGDK